MKIKCGKYDVLSSGSVIGFEEEPIEMIFKIDGEEYTFRFVFEIDENNRETRAEINPESANLIEIFIINSISAFGVGSEEPVELGEIKGRKLLLSHCVYTCGNSREKLLHYTWYLL